MKDPEFIQLRKRLFIGLIIIIIYAIPLCIFINNKFFIKDSNIITRIDNKENIVLILVDKSFNNEKNIKNTLSNNNINYVELNINKINYYDKLLNKLGISSNEISPPSIIYIENGVFTSILNNIDNEDITMFLEYNNLIEKMGDLIE